MKKKKTFDCVEMQHRGGQKVQQETRGMTLEEEVAYWHRRTEELRRRQAAEGAREAPNIKDSSC